MTFRMLLEKIYSGNGITLHYPVKLGKEDYDAATRHVYIPKGSSYKWAFCEKMLDREIKAFAAKGKDDYVIEFEEYT